MQLCCSPPDAKGFLAVHRFRTHGCVNMTVRGRARLMRRADSLSSRVLELKASQSLCRRSKSSSITLYQMHTCLKCGMLGSTMTELPPLAKVLIHNRRPQRHLKDIHIANSLYSRRRPQPPPKSLRMMKNCGKNRAPS